MKEEMKPSWMEKNTFNNCWRRRNASNSEMNCKGCGESLPVYKKPNGKVHLSLEFRIHCIQDCEEYRALGEDENGKRN